MAYDLCSLTQDGETSISFMSQAIGLMADLDLGTENLVRPLQSLGTKGFITTGLKSDGWAILGSP